MSDHLSKDVTASNDEAGASAGGRVSHTPGPWRIYEFEHRYPGIESERLSVVLWGHEDEDAGVRGHTHAEAIANAHLIAAAPKMLEALREVAHHADDECGFMVLVRAAILKAEGR